MISDRALSAIELQGLADLAQFLLGQELGHDTGLVKDGKTDREACVAMLRRAKAHGITPRDPIVNPLELLTSMLVPDVGIPEPNVNQLLVEVPFQRITDQEQEVPYYRWLMMSGNVEIGDVKCTKSGLEFSFQGTVWRVNINEIFGLFAKKYGA